MIFDFGALLLSFRALPGRGGCARGGMDGKARVVVRIGQIPVTWMYELDLGGREC